MQLIKLLINSVLTYINLKYHLLRFNLHFKQFAYLINKNNLLPKDHSSIKITKKIHYNQPFILEVLQ